MAWEGFAKKVSFLILRLRHMHQRVAQHFVSNFHVHKHIIGIPKKKLSKWFPTLQLYFKLAAKRNHKRLNSRSLWSRQILLQLSWVGYSFKLLFLLCFFSPPATCSMAASTVKPFCLLYHIRISSHLKEHTHKLGAGRHISIYPTRSEYEVRTIYIDICMKWMYNAKRIQHRTEQQQKMKGKKTKRICETNRWENASKNAS